MMIAEEETKARTILELLLEPYKDTYKIGERVDILLKGYAEYQITELRMEQWEEGSGGSTEIPISSDIKPGPIDIKIGTITFYTESQVTCFKVKGRIPYLQQSIETPRICVKVRGVNTTTTTSTTLPPTSSTTTTTTSTTTTTIPYSGVIEGLTASPNPARARETVTLSFIVKNTDTPRITYKLVGKVEGSCVNQQGQRDITLNPGESQTINV